jgi:hypothetical protein
MIEIVIKNESLIVFRFPVQPRLSFFMLCKSNVCRITNLFLDYYTHKSENFALTLYAVWLLVRAVTGGACDGYAKKQKLSQRAFSPNKRTRSQTSNFKYLWLDLSYIQTAARPALCSRGMSCYV